MRQAAPPGMKVNVVNIEKAVAVYHNPQYQDETVFYLFTRPQDALAMVRQGVKIGTLNIGGMAWRPGKKQLTKAVSLDDDDINAFHELNNLGVITGFTRRSVRSLNQYYRQNKRTVNRKLNNSACVHML